MRIFPRRLLCSVPRSFHASTNHVEVFLWIDGCFVSMRLSTCHAPCESSCSVSAVDVTSRRELGMSGTSSFVRVSSAAHVRWERSDARSGTDTPPCPVLWRRGKVPAIGRLHRLLCGTRHGPRKLPGREGFVMSYLHGATRKISPTITWLTLRWQEGTRPHQTCGIRVGGARVDVDRPSPSGEDSLSFPREIRPMGATHDVMVHDTIGEGYERKCRTGIGEDERSAPSNGWKSYGTICVCW